LKDGVDNPSKLESIKDKKKRTCNENHKVDYGFQQTEKTEKTMMEKYGVKNASESPELLQKQQKSARLLKNYKNTDITYQGSYEKDFLDKYFNELNIENGITFKYYMNGKKHTYQTHISFRFL
jgi:hypothetical protein